MKIVVIGGGGTVGSAVVAALSDRHEVLAVSRRTQPRVDLEEPGTLGALFAKTKDIDALVCCAGQAAFKPLSALTAEDFAFSLKSKLMGQVAVVRAALAGLKDGGSVTVTSGVLAQNAAPGAAAVSLVNAGLEGFVRVAALEAPRGIRVNVVSPPWLTETLQKLNMEPTGGLPAAVVARSYVEAVEGHHNGQTLRPTPG